jgi:hypothetical protein
MDRVHTKQWIQLKGATTLRLSIKGLGDSINGTQETNILYQELIDSILLCRVSRFSFCYAECKYAECSCDNLSPIPRQGFNRVLDKQGIQLKPQFFVRVVCLLTSHYIKPFWLSQRVLIN